eukprot:s870_g24.t1
MLKWAAMALPVIASFLAWTAGWMETEEALPLDELDLSGFVSEMTTGSTVRPRSTECIYSFPSPTVLRSSSLERIWLEQVVSKNWCPMKPETLTEAEVTAVLRAFEKAKKKFPHQDVMKQDILSTAFAPMRSFDISSMFVQHFGDQGPVVHRRFLLYLNFHWSIYSRHGFEMLKTIATFVPEDVEVVSARISSWFPEKDTPLGKILSREVREGRMIDSFTKYRAVMLYIEDGKVVAMRLNIGTTSEECLRKEAVELWNLPRNFSTGYVSAEGSTGAPDFLRTSCYVQNSR